MALVVEDGTGIVGAESYISVADATAYWALRTHNANAAAWTSSTTPKQEGALREASTYLDGTWGQSYPGIRLTATQGLLWPRVMITERDCRRWHRFNLSDYPCWPAFLAECPDTDPMPVMGLDGLALPLVPVQIKTATIELAVRALAGPLAEDVGAQGRYIERDAGSSKIVYADGAQTADPTYGIVARILAPILEGGGNWAWR